jgi:hypothetical protein
MKKLFTHFRHVHLMNTNNQSKDKFICGQNGCKQTLKNISCFRYHLGHCEAVSADPVRHDTNTPSTLTQQSFNSNPIDNEPYSEECDSLPNNIPNQTCPFSKAIGNVILQLRAKHNVSHAAINCLTKGIQTALEEAEPKSMTDLAQIFKKFDTQSKRNKFFDKHLGFKAPAEKVLGRRQVTRHKQGMITRKFVPTTFQYISIRQTLTTLFSNLTFFNLYFSERPSNDGFIRSHRDSQHFKNHKLFSEDPFALRLQIFFDEVETTNALGSKTKIHELGMFCFSILNLPPSCNSLLSNIHAFAVCVSKLIKKHGFDGILNLLMEEVAILESASGMLLNIPHHPGFRIRGTIASFCADTKGAHELGGLMSPSCDRFCRICLTRKSDIRSHSTTDNLELRTPENYDVGVRIAEEMNQGDSNTGLKRNCALNKSRFFNFVLHPVLDAMHDFLEGVVPFILKLVLRYFVLNAKEYGISAKVLNDRIRMYSYGSSDSSNKPSPRFTQENLREQGNYNIKQRAAQAWCLIKNFPLMFGDLIPRKDPYFSLVLSLLDIMDIIFSPVLSPAHISQLREMIDTFYFDFNRLFPDVNPINKFHHMIHYPDIIKMHGPPIRYWCMRYEAFHNIVKRKAQLNCNFTNISKSIAHHLQSVFCANMQSDDGFKKHRVEVGPNLFVLSSLNAVEKFPLVESFVKPNHPVLFPPWVLVNGWMYRTNSAIVLKKSFETISGYPEFGKIQKIVVQNDEVAFIVSHFNSLFDKHFHAFELHEENPPLHALFLLNNIPDCEPLSIVTSYKWNGISYVNPRHIV